MQRLGIVAATFSGLSFAELEALAREAESAGFDTIFLPEFMNDALANCQIVLSATSKLRAATWVSNIYLRHPLLCAQTAVAIDYTSRGRLILGLGVSHRPIVENIYHETMDRPREFLRRYVNTVRQIITGDSYPDTPIEPAAATYGVPIHIAALALETVELAGELADGVMLDLCPVNRLPKVLAALDTGANRRGRTASSIDITLGLLACISNDQKAAEAAGREALAAYAALPFYSRLFEKCGFKRESDAIVEKGGDAVSDEMLHEMVLIGPGEQCRDQLAAWLASGVRHPIIRPVPVGGENYSTAFRNAIATFRQTAFTLQ